MFRRLTGFIMVMVLLLCSVTPVWADELSERRAQLKEIQKKMELQRSYVTQKKKQERSVMQEIKRLENEMAKTQREINTLERKEQIVVDNIGVTQAGIHEAQNNLDTRTALLNERLVRVYQAGEVSYLEVLFTAADFSEFLNRWDLLKEIVRQDKDLIEAITAERRVLEEKKKNLQQKKQELSSLKASKRTEKAKLKDTTQQKEDVLQSVQRERKLLEKALAEEEENSREIEKIIQRMQNSTGAYQGTGTFCWPLPGCRTITSEYGWRFHPILKERRMHTGIDIRGPKGASILAADSGKVIYRGYMGGYGNVIIIDHGGGISTLYAHQSAFLVSEGQSVTKSSRIGKVGSTGWSTGNHLHFEVRRNGVPINPHGYI